MRKVFHLTLEIWVLEYRHISAIIDSILPIIRNASKEGSLVTHKIGIIVEEEKEAKEAKEQ